MDAKSTKNTIKFAQQSLEYFENAENLAKLVNMEDRIPYLTEYVVLNNALIGNAHFQEKSLAEALNFFNQALDSNKATLNNQETLIRESYIYTELLKVALIQKDFIRADKFAWGILKNAQKITDLEKKLKYLQYARDGFFDSKNTTGLEKAWKIMLKVAKRTKDEELFKTKAEIYETYGKYLMKEQGKSKTVVKYLSKALKIFTQIKLQKKVESLQILIKSVNS